MSVTTLFDRAVAGMQKVEASSANVTRKVPIAGDAASREATTGWRAITPQNSTIKMVIMPRGASFNFLGAGLYASEDAVGIVDPSVGVMYPGEHITTSDPRTFIVKSVKKHYWLNKLAFLEVQLSDLAAWQAYPGTLTWSKTRPKDPRERTKVYIDTYVRDAQLTLDDDSTQAEWACIFSDPSYPLIFEFRVSPILLDPVFGLYVVEMPNSTADLDFDNTPYGYTEHVPIHIITVDSTACTGTALNWKMEAELRYVCENNPEGSQRSLEFSRKLDRNLGGMWLYDRLFTLTYWRDTS